MKLKLQIIKFGLIGALNTAVDIGSFYLLLSFGVPTFAAFIIATSLGILCSYCLNRYFTFGSSQRVFGKFLAVTLVGLWVIQPAIILGVSNLFGISDPLGQTIIKLFATAFSLVWNFVWYRLIFTAPRPA